MNRSMLLKLTLRDMRKVLNLRTLLIWGTLSVFGIFFFFATGGKTILLQKGEVDFMAVFLPQIIFGAWAVLSIYFDLVAADRQHNVLDCILCAGVAKPLIFAGKIIALAVTSLLLSFCYLLPVTVTIAILGGSVANLLVLVRYLLPLWGYIMVFAALGLAVSVLARSVKAALIASMAAGLILMPRFFVFIVEGFGALFHWSEATMHTLSMIAPGVMMNALANAASTTSYFKTGMVFGFSVAAFGVIALIVFIKQDELSYGQS